MATKYNFQVIDKVQDPSYNKWVVEFVKRALRRAKIQANVVEIIDIDPLRSIDLDIDGAEYSIRTWDMIPFIYDQQDRLCGGRISFTVYKMVPGEPFRGMKTWHGEEVCTGKSTVMWNND